MIISTLSHSLMIQTVVWKISGILNTLGILNEENKSKMDLQEETQKHFSKSIKYNSSG